MLVRGSKKPAPPLRMVEVDEKREGASSVPWSQTGPQPGQTNHTDPVCPQLGKLDGCSIDGCGLGIVKLVDGRLGCQWRDGAAAATADADLPCSIHLGKAKLGKDRSEAAQKTNLGSPILMALCRGTCNRNKLARVR